MNANPKILNPLHLPLLTWTHKMCIRIHKDIGLSIYLFIYLYI